MSTPAPPTARPPSSFLLSLYATLLEAGSPLLELYLRRRLKAGREDTQRFGERHGIASRPRPEGFLIWFHAASVGESMSMLRLLDRLLEERPGLSILVTTGTVTSAAMVAERLKDRVVHQYVPVDRPAWVRRFLDHWRPDCAIWIESEIWPNLLTGIADRQIPAALVNARMSERSRARWSLAPNTIRRLLGSFTLCLAQTEDEAQRLGELGARDVRYVGHLKFAADPLPADGQALEQLKSAIGTRPLWVLASSHEGEEEIAIAAHRRLTERFPDLLTVIVPRHTKRGGAIADLAEAAGLTVSLRSSGLPPAIKDGIYISDSMGELGIWYRLTRIACIGGSLVPIGGHNPIEAAQLGCALLYGPHMFTVAGVAAELQAENAAVIVSDDKELADAVAWLTEDKAAALAMATAARGIAERNRHVLDRAFAVLDPLIDRAEQGRSSP
ncbi:MAG TPA: 3-deoxy-D-manno-octulosonic acid transferase [Alphaproteobacteria bacterium]|nr:3-deoxy-D-manno-octulosonic acid transferase [Alphaproteobacteria bacterium]